MAKLADALGFDPAELTKNWVYPTAGDRNYTTLQNKLKNMPSENKAWNEIQEKLKRFGVTPESLIEAIYDSLSLANFLRFVADALEPPNDRPGTPGVRDASQTPPGDATVEEDDMEASSEGSGNNAPKEGDKGGGNNARESALGDGLAPLISSRYVGINWPYARELSDHFGQAYKAIFGSVFPDKADRHPEEQVVFFYRLGFEDVTTRHTEPVDGVIRIRDQRLRLVIRRVPARICYQEPFDEWLTYEEAYWNERQGRLYTSRGVIYGFNGGMTLLCRDDTAAEPKVAPKKKLALAHFGFVPALAPDQTDHDDEALQYYIGSIAMESDVARGAPFAPTAYRCLLRKAPDRTKWDKVKAQTKESPGKSKTISLDCARGPDDIFHLEHGEGWNREGDILYGGRSHSWRWYFNRLNINRHVADLLTACPSDYRRWPESSVAIAPATTEERQPLHNAGRRRRGKPRETEPE